MPRDQSDVVRNLSEWFIDLFIRCGAQKKTLDPIWNETFNFSVSYETIVSHNLVFFVYDWDASGNNRVIGAAEIAIAQVDFRTPIMQDWLLVTL